MVRDRDDIQEAQGWSAYTLLELALRFIDERELYAQFDEFLEKIASDENGG
jgi:hypothetical protein